MISFTTSNGTSIRRLLGGRSNVFLISCDNRNILVDTSTKTNRRSLINRLDSLSIKPGSLSALILTHAHFDHAANAATIRNTYNAKIIVSEREAGLLESGTNAPLQGAVPVTRFLYNILMKRFNVMDRLGYAPCKHDIVVRGRHDLKDFGFNAYIVPTPGHTAGSMSVIVDDEIAIAGDALVGVFPGSVLPPWAADREQMVRSWKILLDTGCRLFHPSHGRPRDRGMLLKQCAKHAARLR